MRYVITSGNSKTLQNKKTIQSIMGSFLQSHGYSVTLLKIDGHLNYDLRNTDLRIRGEVFVLSDGCEVDLSLGAFERSCNVFLTRDNYLTLGKILFQVIEQERECQSATELLDVYPAVERYLRSHIMRLSNRKVLGRDGVAAVPDFLIIDIGGLVFNGDFSPIESAILKFISLLDKSEFVLMNIDIADQVSEIEICAAASRISEFYNSIDIKNGVLSFLISEKRGKYCIFKTSLKSKACKNDILCQTSALDYAHIFEKLKSTRFLGIFGSLGPAGDGAEQVKRIRADAGALGTVRIGILAELEQKYNPYLSIEDTLVHAGRQNSLRVDVEYIYLSNREDNIPSLLKGLSGILLPGGFGSQLVETKLAFVKFARENDIPFLGICLGFQLAIIEFARNVLGMQGATSEEFDPEADDPVIHRVPALTCTNTGRDIFLGAYFVECRGEASDIYKKDMAAQRFRHRYALQNRYRRALEEHGMQLVGKTTHDRIVIFKLKNHRFFAGVQYHPELGSTHGSIDPIISAFVCEAMVKRDEKDT